MSVHLWPDAYTHVEIFAMDGMSPVNDSDVAEWLRCIADDDAATASSSYVSSLEDVNLAQHRRPVMHDDSDADDEERVAPRVKGR